MNSKHPSQKTWNFTSKIVFKFTFVYFSLFFILLFFAFFLETPLRWFADTILNWGADFKMESTGSGDRSFDYVRFFLNLILAFFTCIVWSVLDKRRITYTTLFYWLQSIYRLFLCVAMMVKSHPLPQSQYTLIIYLIRYTSYDINDTRSTAPVHACLDPGVAARTFFNVFPLRPCVALA